MNSITTKVDISMKQISASLFFTVLWRGVCQALGWFFGLFGYKRDGKFSKCIWGLFATSGAIVMAFFALAIVCAGVEVVYDRYYRPHYCDDEYCYHSEYINRDIYFHNTEDGKGYIYNKRTGEKLIKHIAWIAAPLGKDTLVCYSNGKKRGYFSKNTGKVIIEPKYDHAWVFSDGLASVEEDGYIKFIDATGKVVIDKKIAYVPNMDGYMFHGGYCVIMSNDNELCGLMDKTGELVLPMEYKDITPNSDHTMWTVTKGQEMAALDKDLKTVLSMSECSIYINEGTIDVAKPDHTIWKYDLQGQLINDFYITGMRMLEYEKDEIVYRNNIVNKVDEDITEYLEDSYRPKAIARLRVYIASAGYEGLMTAEGHAVTKPLYKNIEAIGHDLYLCEVTNGDKVILNGKGEMVK